MAKNRGCCRRANTALTRDCMPVRLPNWEEGYLTRWKRFTFRFAVGRFVNVQYRKVCVCVCVCVCVIHSENLHSSIEATNSRVNEASHHSV